MSNIGKIGVSSFLTVGLIETVAHRDIASGIVALGIAVLVGAVDLVLNFGRK